MSSSVELRQMRKELVLAAERVIKAAFSSNKRLDLKKSQLNHLVGICGEASCAEEVENYIRYQAGRDKTGWELELAHQVIGGIHGVTQSASDADRLKAWSLYAVYLTRSFTYENKVREDARRVMLQSDEPNRRKQGSGGGGERVDVKGNRR